MEIQALEDADLKLLTNLQPADWPDIIPHHQFYLQSDFCFPVKVMVKNNIAGIGVTIKHHDVAWLAHIIVHPEYRNKGLGKLITQTLVNRAKLENCETVYLIATELGAPVYKKIGFITEVEYLGFKDGKIRPDVISDRHIIKIGERHKEHILKMDSEVSGENRDFRLKSYFAGGYVYEVNDKIQGYYLPAFGEGLVAADNATAGIELLKRRVTQSNNVRCPVDNIAAVQFFRQNGYTEYLNQKRMRLGKERAWQPANLYSRTGGQVG